MNNASKQTAFRLWEAVCYQTNAKPKDLSQIAAPGNDRDFYAGIREAAYRIHYEDRQVLVCQKAPGIAVQSASVRTNDLVHMLKEEWRRRGTGESYLGVVHRIDQPVQGLLVFAKNPQAAAALSRQVQNGQMKKTYVALCEGIPGTESGTLTDYLKKDGKTNRSEIVKETTEGAKRAVLDYRVIASEDGYSLLAIDLQTGRHHQIRVQLAGAGWPIVGDQKYGVPAKRGEPLHLCAAKLSFVHPATKKRMEFSLSDNI